MKIRPYGRQFIDKKDIQSVSKTLKKDKITTGSEIINFERKIKHYLKCKYSIVCNSGTSALYLALSGIGLKKNDNVIMPSINFIASYNVLKLLGCNIFLTDVDQLNGQMTPNHVIECISKFKIKKVSAIILMYNGGYPNNIKEFYKLKKKYNCFIVEDACHALGAEYQYKKKYMKIGSCKHSDVATFSLHPLKSITTGEGGIVTTNSRKINYKIEKIRSLGIIKNKKKHWDYNVGFHGLNFRLNEFQSSLGISQLKKIKSFLRYRKKIYEFYYQNLKKISKIDLPLKEKQTKPSYHLFIINLKNSNLKYKEKFLNYMIKKGIMIQFHYIPIFKFKIFKGKFIGKNAKKYYESGLSLPIYYGLKYREQKYILKQIKKFFKIK